jgi:monoamine oxidase
VLGRDVGFKIKGLTVDQPTTVSSTAEPASLILVGTGFAGLAATVRRSRAAAKRV